MQPGCTEPGTCPHEDFRQEVEKELTGKGTEPWALVYFKLYRSQMPVIEQTLETAARMLGSDKSRGYCLEMICADFLAGANLDNGDPETLLFSATRRKQGEHDSAKRSHGCGSIPSHTRVCDRKYFAATAGAVDRVAECRT